MEGDFIKINEWLTPLSWIYGLGVSIRNICFDTGILRQHSFNTPVIAVGNLTVGGCGKTPHVEYLIELLKDDNQVAVLSRGYKRKSKGYIRAEKNTEMPVIGDEPYQMKQKHPDVYVAVDADRVHGIKRILDDKETSDTDVILLDDAYQHRYVKPGVNILLVDYHRLIIYDKLLPAGRLREPAVGKERADVVIVTKCPEELRPMDYRVLTRAMNLRPYQKLFFTNIAYDNLVSYKGKKRRELASLDKDTKILVLSGIASPQQMISDLKAYSENITTLTYPDHHQFRKKDLDKINSTFEKMEGKKIIITTEKDVTRLHHLDGLSQEVISNLFILPIHIEFKLDQQEQFNEYIQSYVMKNSKNSVLNKG